MSHATLLLVDDDYDLLESTADDLRSAGYRVETALTCDDACTRIGEARFDAVVSDVHLPDHDGFRVLEFTRRRMPQTPVILMTGLGRIDAAVAAMRGGAFDYLTKPVMGDELHQCLGRALHRPQASDHQTAPDDSMDHRVCREGLIGRDFKMLQAFDLVERVADTRTTVLIQGESGTGKTMTARAIHQLSARRDKPFVEVACGSLSETLLESELFGHVAGSFTGALHHRVGKFLQADGGTIFLDEIGNASPGLQARLLRVLQDREFEPVGGNETQKVDIRLILATNADLEASVARGEFRQDLFYRINVIALDQPPLRERSGDIPLLLDHYLAIFREETRKPVTGFDVQAIEVLQRYRWPGNIRELVNIVERAVILTRRTTIGVEHLPPAVCRAVAATDLRHAPGAVAGLKAALVDPERQIILDALSANGWSRQTTADALGINRTTLYKKMKRHGIEFDREMTTAQA
ncbi:MAG: sigma-54-dependent Fis family transcriptional regulator [Planctomycetaceae bacterium]|nr:sigma-54-dependent Fis family transcriptional regulator [Planctomycetaceae bacterium]